MREKLDEVVNAVRSGVLKTGYPLVETMPEKGTPEGERGKLYTAVDNNGNVFLIVNPITWRVETDKDGIRTAFRPKPKLHMTYAQAHEAIMRRAKGAGNQKETNKGWAHDRF